MKKPYSVLCCCAREDQNFLENLKKHLLPLEREGWITVQTDMDISPGMEPGREIDRRLEDADIILLLVSADFLGTTYCYDVEMHHALERHKLGLASVTPIILRPCDWQHSPLKDLPCLPHNGKPVTQWEEHQDEAFLDITQGIRKIVQELTPPPVNSKPEESISQKAVHLQTIQEALLDRDYDAAVQEIALVKPFSHTMLLHEQAKLRYLEALVRLQGKRPRIQKFTTIEKVEQLLSGASEYHNLYSYTYLLAIIKDDYADFNACYWKKEEANDLMDKALNITPIAEDHPNIELLSYVQPALFKQYRSSLRT